MLFNATKWCCVFTIFLGGVTVMLLDTNVLIDYLKGFTPALTLINEASQPVISIISFIELLVGVTDPAEVVSTRHWLSQFTLARINDQIAERAIEIRQTTKIKLPDALILATAHERKLVLYTHNTRDVNDSMESVMIPYKL